MAGVTGKYGVVIIGSGFGGIGMGIALGKAGVKDFVILEKNSDLGGTWRDNLYPGCACDVPSPVYSFSYELNPAWTRLFAPQPEIWDYLRSCSAKYGIDEHIRYGVRVDAMEWDDAARTWTVRTSTGDVYEARSVVSAAGALHIPKFPEIAGADSFAGPSFHSSHWDHSVDLTGKRVAVIGTAPRTGFYEWRLLRCPCEYGSTRKNARDTTAATASRPTCSNSTTWACRPRPGPVRCPLPWRPLPGGRRPTARSTR